MKSLPYLLLYCCLGATLHAQDTFESRITAIKELPPAQQLDSFQRALQESGHSSLQKARLHHELGVACFFQDDLLQAIEQTEKALRLRLGKELEAREEVLQSAYNLGSFYHNLQDFDQALAYFQLIADRAPNSRMGYTLYRLGSIYQETGEFQLSEQAFAAALKESPYPEDEVERATLLNDWAEQYLKQDEAAAARKAIPLLQEALPIFRRVAATDDFYATDPVLALNRLGLAYAYSGQYPEAIATFAKALDHNRQCCRDQVLEATIYTNQGITYRRMGQLEKALENHRRSLEIRNTTAKTGAVNMGMALGHDNLATALLHLGRFAEGLQQVQLALQWAISGFSPGPITDNPSLELLQASPNKKSLLIYLQDKADLLQEQALAENRDILFAAALDTYRRCDELIDLMRQDHLEKRTKLFWREQARDMYRSAVKAAWTAQRPDMVFYFSEKSRAVLLLDGLKEWNAHSRLSAETQNQLSRLSSRIQYLERVIYEQRESKSRQEDQLLLLQQAYKHLLDSLEQAEPDYYRQKYRPDLVDLPALQKSLKDGEAWIEYFTTDDFSVAMVIGRQDIAVRRLAGLRELNPDIQAFLKTLRDYEADFDPAPATVLYRQLIGPLNLPPGARLTIAPDGPLSLMPFEALLKSRPARDQPYDQWDFLLQSHAIAYAFSASFHLFGSPAGEASNGRILAFAPMAELNPAYGVDASLELPQTGSTARRVAQIFPSDIYLGAQANRAVLESEAPHAAVLHLATHAYLNDEQSAFSYFLVADTLEERRRFYINDLYNNRYRADLVVLSACETGAGKLFLGEGVSSIGRAFAQNGCPNLAMSLWPIDEGATGRLLELYYKNLRADMPKAGALYQAKRDYLAQAGSNKLKHPFRWAGMIYYGVDTPLQLGVNRWPGRGVLLGVFGLVVLAALVFRRRAGVRE